MSMTRLLAITPWPSVSAVFLVVVAVGALWLARGIAHAVIHGVTDVFARTLRLAARSINRAAWQMSMRNRDVLLQTGREHLERMIEREFLRVGETVRKDLAGYPEMHRRLSEAIMRIEEDQEKAADVPPEPPGWAQAVAQVANVDSRDTSGVLTNIHRSMLKSQQDALEEYRKVSGERHVLLRRMAPHWRDMRAVLSEVNKTVQTVTDRGISIDRHMEQFEQIVGGEDRAVSVLYSSSLVYFFISAVVLAIATAGAAVNFKLIARPMAEMVGGTTYTGHFRTADIAALVIIMVELSMGLFLMESLRITRLFPVIGALSDRMRRRLGSVAFVILLLMASVEAGLAYMRDMLMQDELATNAVLRGEAADAATAAVSSLLGVHAWIATFAQMGLGFVLPFALVFVAIPLENFVHSLRSVLGAVLVGLLRSIALVLHVASRTFSLLGTLVQHAYDLTIFVPLQVETWMTRMAAARHEEEAFDLPENISAERPIQRSPLRQEAR